MNATTTTLTAVKAKAGGVGSPDHDLGSFTTAHESSAMLRATRAGRCAGVGACAARQTASLGAQGRKQVWLGGGARQAGAMTCRRKARGGAAEESRSSRGGVEYKVTALLGHSATLF